MFLFLQQLFNRFIEVNKVLDIHSQIRIPIKFPHI